MKGHARNVMTERVTAVTPDTPLEAIARTLVAGRFGGVPVVDRRDRVLGFVSEAELVTALLNQANPHATAREIMTAPVVVDEFDTTDEVMRVMRESRSDHVLVLREKRLVGIIAPLDVLRFFVDHVLPQPPDAG
jgi:CBS domain-containing protein